MTLQTSGTISISDINVELGNSATATLDLNSSAARTLADVPSGSISLSDFYGKANISAAAAPGTVAGDCTHTGATCTAVSNITTVTVTGGSGAVTYQWSHTSGTSFIINSPNSQSTNFAYTAGGDVSASGTYKCVATRNGATTDAFVTVNMTISDNS